MDTIRRLWQRARPNDRETTDVRDDDPPTRSGPDGPDPDPAADFDETPEEIAEREDEEREIFPAYDEENQDRPTRPVQPFIGPTDLTPEHAKQTMRIEVPTRTILKIIGTLVAIWLILQVLSIFLLLVLAAFVCLALLPPVRRLERRGLPRVVAAATAYLAILAVVAAFFWLIIPPLADQVESVIENAPEYATTFDRVLEDYPAVTEQIDRLAAGDAETTNDLESEQDEGRRTESSGTGPGPEMVVAAVDAQAVSGGAGAIVSALVGLVGGLANVFFVVVLSFYLLIEGDRTWRWVARYMTPRLRYRFYRLGPELTNVVSGYVLGQGIISSIFGVFSFVVLTILGVPQPLLLSIIGAVAVAIPIVGVPVATIFTMALALTVSWQTSLIVLGVYLVYQQFENYVLLPRVYGNTLQVSALSILVGVLVGGQLLGVLGIVLSLPVTASIPVIERVWREMLPDEVEEMEREMRERAAETTVPS